MPAPCPGDPDYPEGQPLTRETFEAEIERLRDGRAPILAHLDRIERNGDAWDDAARAELPEFRRRPRH